MKRLINYTHIDQIHTLDTFGQICNGIICTATAEMKGALQKTYSSYGLQVIDIHQIIDAILPEWDSEAKQVKNYILLRNCIEEYAENNNLPVPLRSCFERNAFDIWNSILLLTEADVFPDDIEEGDEIANTFKGLWREIEKNNDDLLNVRSVFNNLLGDEKELRYRLKQSKEIDETLLERPLFLMGFYFVTPIQERLLDVIEKWNDDICYLNAFDRNNLFASEIWAENYSKEYESTVRKIRTAKPKSQSFLSLFEEKGQEELKNRVRVIAHSSEFELATSVDTAIKNGDLVYSVDMELGKKLQEIFFPEL